MAHTHNAAKTVGKYVWVKPEIYPLIVTMGAAISLSAYCMARNLMINPDVNILKERRMNGYNTDFKEGEAYRDHSIRQCVPMPPRSPLPLPPQEAPHPRVCVPDPPAGHYPLACRAVAPGGPLSGSMMESINRKMSAP
mmetsp:Transcript_16214/g.50941  ORF Transcript_16214/g.50941 Transcript_16214/m.50941 type:complete len:138 (-) Transcript_16214:1142-1555(-)